MSRIGDAMRAALVGAALISLGVSMRLPWYVKASVLLSVCCGAYLPRRQSTTSALAARGGIAVTLTSTLVSVWLVASMLTERSRSGGDTPGASVDQIVSLVLAIALCAQQVIQATQVRSGTKGGEDLTLLRQALDTPSLVLSFSTASVLCASSLAIINRLSIHGGIPAYLATIMLERGSIPPTTLLFFCWGLTQLLSKMYQLIQEGRFIRVSVAAGDEGQSALAAILSRHESHEQNQSPDAEGEAKLCQYAWQLAGDSYAFLRYITWSIPLLGFLGTVVGISETVQKLGAGMGGQADSGDLLVRLQGLMLPLGVAFDTTLISLSLSIVLGLFQALVQRTETRLLHDFEFRWHSIAERHD